MVGRLRRGRVSPAAGPRVPPRPLRLADRFPPRRHPRVGSVGLPIVVTLAWYHGDRGEQHVGGTELTIVALLFFLGGGVVWYYQRTADTTTTGTSAPAAEKPIPTDVSIAVLPFVNMSADKEQEYFADGISEDRSFDGCPCEGDHHRREAARHRSGKHRVRHADRRAGGQAPPRRRRGRTRPHR